MSAPAKTPRVGGKPSIKKGKRSPTSSIPRNLLRILLRGSSIHSDCDDVTSQIVEMAHQVQGAEHADVLRRCCAGKIVHAITSHHLQPTGYWHIHRIAANPCADQCCSGTLPPPRSSTACSQPLGHPQQASPCCRQYIAPSSMLHHSRRCPTWTRFQALPALGALCTLRTLQPLQRLQMQHPRKGRHGLTALTTPAMLTWVMSNPPHLPACLTCLRPRRTPSLHWCTARSVWCCMRP